jgi:AAA family ATP:ADP antiporter
MTTSARPDTKPSALADVMARVAIIEPHELGPVALSILCFFFLFGSYSIVKPVRDAMGTVYGMSHIQELFTGTFLASFIFAPIYSGVASRIRLSIFLPAVYAFIAISILSFYLCFAAAGEHQDRWLAAAFYIWVSTFNILIISVFWSFMADMFSRSQAQRVFGFIAAGATLGGIAGPIVATTLVKSIGNDGLMLISACGFIITAWLVTRLAAAKERLRVLALASRGRSDEIAQRTTLQHALVGNAFDGFRLLLKSHYLVLLAAFLLLMTWISTIVYIQLGDLISHAFVSREARTQAFATIDLTVNSLAVFVQLFGTGRIVERFGVTTGLLLNPLIMIVAFVAIAFSPVLLVLGGIQVLRRVAEYAVAKPTREMLFTVVDQEARYKAKNVVDTVVYRFGDVSSAWVSSWILPFGVTGLAIFGVVVTAIWIPVAVLLGSRYRAAREAQPVAEITATS